MKKVLVIGAGEYQVPLIKRIKELEHAVYCIDGNSKAPGLKWADAFKIIDVRDKEACLAYAEEIGIDAVMTYGATITLPTVAYIGKRLGLPALDEKVAEISKSKFAIKQCLASGGLNMSGDFFALRDASDKSNKAIRIPCVIKPSDGSGSKGVSIVTDERNIDAAIEYAFDSARFGEIYVEGFIDGEEYSAEVFCGNGQKYVYAIVKTTFYRDDNGDLHYGHRVPSGLPREIELDIENEVLKAVDVLGITMGSVNFDVIVSNENKKPYIIDVGIRIGQNLIASHIVPLSRGVSELDSIIQLSLAQKPDIEPKYKKCIATRLLIYTPGVISAIKDYSDLIGRYNIIDIVLRKGVGDVLKPYKEKSDSCGWVLTCGDTPEEAEANAEAAKHLLSDYIIIS
ncbi:MAG: ATP-grasp domain-containing protein [Clostridia bacterium]|nr:ATP-grasp domain-containing protein [Clostridia bacterium]